MKRAPERTVLDCGKMTGTRRARDLYKRQQGQKKGKKKVLISKVWSEVESRKQLKGEKTVAGKKIVVGLEYKKKKKKLGE